MIIILNDIFQFQEDYHVADLRKELSNVKKLLSDERRRSTSDGQKMTDTQVLFAQVLKDYNSAIENVKQLQQEKRSRVSYSQRRRSGGGISNVILYLV